MLLRYISVYKRFNSLFLYSFEPIDFIFMNSIGSNEYKNNEYKQKSHSNDDEKQQLSLSTLISHLLYEQVCLYHPLLNEKDCNLYFE